MMKKMLCMLALLGMIFSFGAAETIVLPDQQPVGAAFSCDIFSLTLPFGMSVMDTAAMEGYEAAVQSDFPDTGETILVATGADASSAITIFAIDSDQDCVTAAQEAAAKILGDSEAAKETICGENRCGSFSCAVGDLQFDLYYLNAGDTLLIAGASGVVKAEMENMLAGISF